MSKETQEWLNTNVLVGFTKSRGNAWHWREGTDNHYEGSIPVAEVERRLFHWTPKVSPMYYDIGQGLRKFEGKSVIVRDDTNEALGAASDGYQVHSYSQWLIQNVSNVLDDRVQIGSAGLLKGGAVAWVQIELPENHVAEGVEFRPTILATTSLDGSIASTYKPVNTIVVCDNTRAAALAETADAYRVKHTKNSSFKVLTARETLGIALERQAEVFTAEIARLVGTSVSDRQFEAYLDVVNAIPQDKGRAKTIAENKRAELISLWRGDPRVSLWKNTVWGVFQMMNTWETHERKFKGERAESTLMSMVTGRSFDQDAKAMTSLEKILANV